MQSIAADRGHNAVGVMSVIAIDNHGIVGKQCADNWLCKVNLWTIQHQHPNIFDWDSMLFFALLDRKLVILLFDKSLAGYDDGALKHGFLSVPKHLIQPFQLEIACL